MHGERLVIFSHRDLEQRLQYPWTEATCLNESLLVGLETEDRRGCLGRIAQSSASGSTLPCCATIPVPSSLHGKDSSETN